MNHFEKLEEYTRKERIPARLAVVIKNFYLSYGNAIEENNYSIQSVQNLLATFLDLVAAQLADPYIFEPYHQRILKPFNYYLFGLDLIRPLIVFSKSAATGLKHVQEMQEILDRGENVILFGNHQTEPDPQAISLLLEESHPHFAEEMIFVAGHRVTSDPLAVPLSMGRNLLCIYSRRHIETELELKKEKLLYNQRTMKKMSQLLSSGGKCIYVAPGGGRDRRNAAGDVEVAPFDPDSIEMFWLMAKKSGRPAHFFPLALATHSLLPPPSSIEKRLGERRDAHCTPVHLAFGPAIEMESFSKSRETDKKKLRQARAEYIWKIVAKDYEKLRAVS
jgi:glycerol-3-phosphate O-acyltransferase